MQKFIQLYDLIQVPQYSDKINQFSYMIEENSEQSGQPTMKERFQATMVLAAVGDAIGYRGGSWEFNFNGAKIHKQLMSITSKQGIKGLRVEQYCFPYSDDTVMHIATANGLLDSEPDQSLDRVCTKVAKRYKQCMKYMDGRAPGSTCIRSAKILNQEGSNWKDIVFQKNAGGCGASMRAACIGLYYYNNMQRLIQVSIETGRTTHHNPLGYLGSFVAALFTAFAIQGIPPHHWLSLLFKEYMPRAEQYIKNNRQSQQNLQGGDWKKFIECWEIFADRKNMSLSEPKEPIFPQRYGVQEREAEYLQYSINGWPGALGVDSVIIAYDALLSSLDYEKKSKQEGIAVNKWQEVCLRGMLHGGDNDSTGTIVGAWYGALYGYRDVYKINYEHCEGRSEIMKLGADIYEKVYNSKEDSKIEQQK